ncbi:MAG: TonB-dependent receptor [Flavobacteriales bacterium]|nr:TonB-dependent receptor [Flavobacteriales bacterium]
MKRFFPLILVLFSIEIVQAQSDSANIFGKVIDEDGQAIQSIPIAFDSTFNVFTDANGKYNVTVRWGKSYRVRADNYGTIISKNTPVLRRGQSFEVNFLFENNTLTPTEISIRNPKIITIPPRTITKLTSLQIEDVVARVSLGVSKRNELGSAYNVRGGNFDENLVYVNDIEVYRPFLARSGQQEGLSFINPYMTKSIQFSSGGFEAKYGDKMSSVLNVTYNEPRKLSGAVEASLMGGSIQVQDRPAIRFSYSVGARYRSLQYLLNSLDVSGDYRPKFVDIQSDMSFYNLTHHLTFSWFSTYSQNQYLVVPQSRETNFGTIQNAVRLYIGFGGAEKMDYKTFLNAITVKFRPNDSTTFKLIGSNFNSQETEHFTIEGAYRLEQLENNPGSDNFASARALLGYGYFINHARNSLNVDVSNLKLMASIKRRKHNVNAGATYQIEKIKDYLKEWNFNDSSGYRLNSSSYPANEIHLDDYVKMTNMLNTNRIMAYIQDEVIINKDYNATLNWGIRANHWSLNKETTLTPRAIFSFEPNRKHNNTIQAQFNEAIYQLDANIKNYADTFSKIKDHFTDLRKRDLFIKASLGAYYQPPFYRELRNIYGVLNTNLQSQKSYHFMLSSDLTFKAWGRDFKWINEAYYKLLKDLVPYTIDNVKLRYLATNSSEGYAAGFDTRVNGEFIEGLESWINFGILTTKENIEYKDSAGNIKHSGFISRPTDQRLNFSILFQDELPSDSSYKMNISLVLGSKLPYYFGGEHRYSRTFSLPEYRRVDIGFSKEIKPKKLSQFESFWLSLEVFNLLQVNNVASFLWVKDLNNNVYGVPNYLTGRRLNIKLIGRF